MKLTCLSQGRGYHFPSCHIVDLCGFRILFDCPLDPSALSAFAPVAANSGPCLNAVPWYKTVNSLHLWDASFIDVVLISSATGMLGLPFIARKKGFSGKIYASEVTMKLGQLMMDDLIYMHREFRHIYGPENSEWMKWEGLERLSPGLKEILLGKEGSELGGWLPLYNTADVRDCIQRVQPLRFGEEVCYNGTLVVKAISSGLDIGASNWTINTPKLDVAYMCSSVAGSSHAMDFDYRSLQARDVIIYSDASSFHHVEGDTEDETAKEEMDKLVFICSCAFDALTSGGSVLIPIGRLGVILLLLEQISTHQGLSALRVPIFMISSVSEELLSLTNVVPEWLSKQKQEKLFAGEPLFAHVDLLKEKRLHLIPDVCSPKLVKVWREPCIVFCPHWSLRLGASVHLLRYWSGDENSLLVLEDGVDPDTALLPFKPMKMKVLHCSFNSGIRLQKIVPLMEKLQPKLVLFPEVLTKFVNTPIPDSVSFLNYSENETVRVPRLRMSSELEIAADLPSEFQWKTVNDTEANLMRLRGELSMYHGKQRLLLGTKPIDIDSSHCRSLLHWGTLEIGKLFTALEKMGINGSVDEAGPDGSDVSFVVHVAEPYKALIEVKPKSAVISTSDEKFGSALFEAIHNTLDGI